jgi:hypothetical protein
MARNKNTSGGSNGYGNGAQNHRKAIVVDGANLAWEEKSRQGKPKLENILAVVETLEQEGFKPIVIVDASLIHEIDDPPRLDALIDRKVVYQVPAGTDADYFVLETARQHDAQIITNDQYREYRERYPDIPRRRVPVMIIGGTVQLYEPALDIGPQHNAQAGNGHGNGSSQQGGEGGSRRRRQHGSRGPADHENGHAVSVPEGQPSSAGQPGV